MNDQHITIGFKKEWEIFFQNHPLWPQKYQLLIETLEKVFIRQLEPKQSADTVVFYIGRLCVEDLNEIFLLCGNGYGFAALKILRGFYEKVVTAGYISRNPDHADSFLEYHFIHEGKMLIHAERTMDMEEYLPSEKIKEIKNNYQKYKEKFQEVICKKCGTTKTRISWSDLDILSMAKKADLDGLYFHAYYYPTLQIHATPTTFLSRLRQKHGNSISFNEKTQREWAERALVAAHNLIIRILDIQNTYFDLHLSEEIEERKEDFSTIWGKQN